MDQYPDTISLSNISAPVQDAGTGNYTSGAASTAVTYKCRAEKNSFGGKITGTDGSVYDYSFTVYMPRTSDIYFPGDLYTLTLSNGRSYTGRIKDFNSGQLNSRVWL